MTRVSIGAASEFSGGKAKAVDVNGTSIVVVQVGDGYCAVKNKCSHLPLPLAGGKVEGDTIQCPFHGSQYNLCTGENVDWVRGIGGIKLPGWSRKLIAMGKKPDGVATYTVTEEDGTLYVEVSE